MIAPGTFYQESIRAAKILNRRAILLIGENPPPAELAPDTIAVDYLPYSQILNNPWGRNSSVNTMRIRAIASLYCEPTIGSLACDAIEGQLTAISRSN